MYVAPCLAAPYFLYDCLIIDRPFSFAFLHGICVDNLDQEQLALTTSCFDLETEGDGSGFGQYVHLYSSAWGVAFSAALRSDAMGSVRRAGQLRVVGTGLERPGPTETTLRRAGGTGRAHECAHTRTPFCPHLALTTHPLTSPATAVDRLSGVYERRWIDAEASWAASFTRNTPRRVFRPRARLRCEVRGVEVEVLDVSQSGTAATDPTATLATGQPPTSDPDNGYRGGPFSVTLDFLPRLDPHILADPQLQLATALAERQAAAAAATAAAGGGGAGDGSGEEEDSSMTLDGEIRFGNLRLRGQVRQCAARGEIRAGGGGRANCGSRRHD